MVVVSVWDAECRVQEFLELSWGLGVGGLALVPLSPKS